MGRDRPLSWRALVSLSQHEHMIMFIRQHWDNPVSGTAYCTFVMGRVRWILLDRSSGPLCVRRGSAYFGVLHVVALTDSRTERSRSMDSHGDGDALAPTGKPAAAFKEIMAEVSQSMTPIRVLYMPDNRDNVRRFPRLLSTPTLEVMMMGTPVVMIDDWTSPNRGPSRRRGRHLQVSVDCRIDSKSASVSYPRIRSFADLHETTRDSCRAAAKSHIGCYMTEGKNQSFNKSMGREDKVKEMFPWSWLTAQDHNIQVALPRCTNIVQLLRNGLFALASGRHTPGPGDDAS